MSKPACPGRGRSRVAAVLLGALAALLAGCRLDVAVSMTVEANGAGEIVVVAGVDGDVVAQVPGVEGALQLPDATAAGWVVDGPTTTDDGGRRVTLRHPFATAEEATALLRSLGPPFGSDLTITRTASEDEVAVALTGTLSLPGGTFEAFGDAALIDAVGALPFSAQLTAAGATPAQSMSVELAVRLPGVVEETTGEHRDGAVVWTAPLDGSTTDLTTRSVLRADDVGGGGWQGTLGTVALVLAVIWLLAGAVVVGLVLRARRRRRNRPRGIYMSDRYR